MLKRNKTKQKLNERTNGKKWGERENISQAKSHNNRVMRQTGPTTLHRTPYLHFIHI